VLEAGCTAVQTSARGRCSPITVFASGHPAGLSACARSWSAKPNATRAFPATVDDLLITRARCKASISSPAVPSRAATRCDRAGDLLALRSTGSRRDRRQCDRRDNLMERDLADGMRSRRSSTTSRRSGIKRNIYTFPTEAEPNRHHQGLERRRECGALSPAHGVRSSRTVLFRPGGVTAKAAGLYA